MIKCILTPINFPIPSCADEYYVTEMLQSTYINVAHVELHVHISICTKTNHGTGVTMNSDKLLCAMVKMEDALWLFCQMHHPPFVLAVLSILLFR